MRCVSYHYAALHPSVPTQRDDSQVSENNDLCLSSRKEVIVVVDESNKHKYTKLVIVSSEGGQAVCTLEQMLDSDEGCELSDVFKHLSLRHMHSNTCRLINRHECVVK